MILSRIRVTGSVSSIGFASWRVGLASGPGTLFNKHPIPPFYQTGRDQARISALMPLDGLEHRDL
jgi:hypothetical protein